MERFKEWLVLKGYAGSTIASVVRTVMFFKQWCEQENIGDVSAVTHNDLVAYVHHASAKEISKKTIAHQFIMLTKYFNWLITEGRVTDNPCSNIQIKGIKRKALYEVLTREELEGLYNNYATEIKLEKTDRMKGLPPPMLLHTLARRRNKIIVGLLVYQGLRSEEIMKLQVSDVKLREGNIFIPSVNRSNERTLKLESHQVFDLLDYINDTRKQIMVYRNRVASTGQLFLVLGEGKHVNNLFSTLLSHLKKLNSKVKTLEQLRGSVIVHWLKLYHLRKVQVMAGHRYISSTESYQASNLDDLKEDVRNYHPF